MVMLSMGLRLKEKRPQSTSSPLLGPGVATVIENALTGTPVTNILNVPSGSTPVFTCDDKTDIGKVIVAGNEGSGWVLSVGLIGIVAGSITGVLSAIGARSRSITITITVAL